MIAGSINEDFSVAVPAELLWKAIFALDASAMEKAFAGMIDAVEIKGDGGLGSLFIMKYNPAMGKTMVLKSRLAVHDHAELVVSFDEVVVEEGGEVASAQFKSQVVQLKLVPAGEGACVVKLTVEYERLDGKPMSPEDKAKLVQGYVDLIKKAEENLVAHPGEFA